MSCYRKQKRLLTIHFRPLQASSGGSVCPPFPAPGSSGAFFPPFQSKHFPYSGLAWQFTSLRRIYFVRTWKYLTLDMTLTDTAFKKENLSLWFRDIVMVTVIVTFQFMFIVQTKSFILLIHQFMSDLYYSIWWRRVRQCALGAAGWWWMDHS